LEINAIEATTWSNRDQPTQLFIIRKTESLFFSLCSDQILSSRVVSKVASVLVKESKLFSFRDDVAKIKSLKT